MSAVDRAGAVVRPAEPDDDESIVALKNSALCSLPPQTIDEYRAMAAAVPDGVPLVRWVALEGARLVGTADFVGMYWTGCSSAYWLDLTVAEDRRRRGIGGALHKRVSEKLASLSAERVYVTIREDDAAARRFAATHGYNQTGHVDYMSRLPLNAVNLEGYADLEAQLLAEGISVGTLAELGVENASLLHTLYTLDLETTKDVPMSEPYDPPFEQWRERFSMPGWSAEAVFIAMYENQPIGMTALNRRADVYGWHNGMGVERAYRGRGVGRLLKLHTILYAHEQGMQYLYTGNAADNPRMYDINVRLGYSPLPTLVEFANDSI